MQDEPLSPVRPRELAKDEYFQNNEAGHIDLSKGFTLTCTIYCEPEVKPETEQVILDIGPSGQSADRLQLFVDLNGSLIFRIAGSSIVIPTGSQILARTWVPLSVQAQLVDGSLRMGVLMGMDGEWLAEHKYQGPVKIGPIERIGAALSGGRGMKLSFLDLAQFSEMVPTAKLRELLAFMAERPKAFGLEHGKQ